MHDVARVAGVSQMTVSRVMRGTGYISTTVQEQVHAAAREIGYVHNRLAGGIAAYDNPIVGVVVPTLQNRVFTEVLSGISDTLTKSGLRPVFGVTEYSDGVEEDVVFDLLSWRPRGLVIPGLEHSDNVRRIIQQTGVRSVEIMDVDGDPIADCVGISHVQAGSEMAQHMIERGYRRFALLSSQGGRDLRASKRHKAFIDVVRQAGGQIVSSPNVDEVSSMVLGRRLTAELLASATKADAIYFSNDDLAAGGVMHCLSEGISMPDDIALAGFNGLEFLDALPISITTTLTPRYQIGAVAAEWITSSDEEGRAGRIQQLEAKLRPGETT